MAITVRIPTPLQRLTNGQGEVSCEGTTVTELLSDLEKRHPGRSTTLSSPTSESHDPGGNLFPPV